jgi:hypothetical protein
VDTEQRCNIAEVVATARGIQKRVMNLLNVGVSENAKADANASNTIFNAQNFANVEGSVGKQTTENTHSPHTMKL